MLRWVVSILQLGFMILIRVISLLLLEVIDSIECQVMENWKIEYVGNNIVTCGDFGRVGFFDLISKEKVKKLDSG
jgi:hypothetical protein